MTRLRHYFLYHNPVRMRQGFRGRVAASGLLSTDKEGVAEQAINDGGIIWCVGREKPEENRYHLYQRVVAQNSK